MTLVPHLIITVDYEVFGNGMGCVDQCVLEPAERMIRIAERFDAPVTFFVEATEFIVKEEIRDDRPVRSQLAQAIAGGHDAQLHIHPQWADATCDENGNWKVDMKRWRVGDIDFTELSSLVEHGKDWLESVVNHSGFRCIAFRAGGWCIQPSEHVMQVLYASGFKVDSTVAPGFWNAAPGEWCDFRKVPELPYWRTQGDVCRAEDDGIFEVPIVTGKIDRARHMRALKRAKTVDGGLASGCEGSYWGPDGLVGRIKGKVSKLARLGHVMLDLSTMSTDVLIDVTQQWIEKHAWRTNGPLPIVAIAHTKNFTRSSEAVLDAYLAWAKNAGLKFSTFGEWLRAVDETK